MNKNLRHFSISHKTATVAQRECYYISEIEKETMYREVKTCFPDISGLLILVTCNRTEFYFESEVTPASQMLALFISRKNSDPIAPQSNLFKKSDKTALTLRHLLTVSSGLSSQVLGDADIVHQIKKAYQLSIEHRLQGSLLERAMQSVFKAHKRISNETEFRDGTTSTAYKALKVITETFRGDHPASKKILLIGTGDIVRQLLKYNAKFNFSDLHISNRTMEKAVSLAGKHGCESYAWEEVLKNDFEDFDVIISAASNCPRLIWNIAPSPKMRLLIDLALPANINSDLGMRDDIIFCDLDSISEELEDTKDKRRQAVGAVNQILENELKAYVSWCHKAPKRAILADYKIILHNKVTRFYDSQGLNPDMGEITQVTDRVMRKLLKNEQFALSDTKLETIIKRQLYQNYA